MDKEIELVKQDKLFKYLKFAVGTEAWFIAYKNLPHNGGFYSVLIENDYATESMKDTSWDLSLGQGLPCCVTSGYGDDQIIEYVRYGKKGVQPLVYYRSFEGVKPSYIEVLEEFRLYHNLFYDAKLNKYIKIDDNGDEEDIIIIEDDNTVKIKLKALKQFLAIKEMSLLFLFDSFYYSIKELEDLGLEKKYASNILDGDLVYSLSFNKVDWEHQNDKSFSRLHGKKIIKGFSKDFCGIWPYNENFEEEYDNFIIDIDENGCEITYTSNPDELDNYFDNNPGAPHYLTPVFFRKEVLNKYYNDPDKYTVSDGYIRCAGLWGVRVDNDNRDYVMVFLGDLGRDLSHKERQHWKSHNIPPDGNKISTTCFKRSFEAEFWDPESPDLKFKQDFSLFNEAWATKYNWELFLPLNKDDAYHYKTLRIALDNQNSFDEQVRGLVKIVIDSINTKKLDELISAQVEGSINKLEQFFKDNNLSNFSEHITFLRNLQNLRSNGIAHRKGSNYQKSIKIFGIEEKSYSQIFEDILKDMNLLLDFLKNNFLL